MYYAKRTKNWNHVFAAVAWCNIYNNKTFLPDPVFGTPSLSLQLLGGSRDTAKHLMNTGNEDIAFPRLLVGCGADVFNSERIEAITENVR